MTLTLTTTMKTLGLAALLAAGLLAQGCGLPLGCGAVDDETGEASLYIVDPSSGAPIASPTFDESGLALSGSCQEPDSAAGACEYYRFYLDRREHTVEIGAPGYAPATVTLDLTQNLSVHLAVELRRLP